MSKLEPDSSSKQANNSSSATESLKKSVKGAPQSSNDPLYSRLNEYEFTRDKANSNVRHLLEKYKRRCPQCTEIQIYYVLKKNDFNEKVCDTHFDSISRRVKTDRFKNSATGNKLFLHQLPEVQHESSNKDTDRETLNADVSAQLDEDIGIYGTGKLRRRRLIKIKDDVKYLDEVHFNDPAGKRRNFSGLQFNRYRGFAKKTANPSYREDNLSNEPATGNMHRNHNNNNNNNGNLMMAGADSKGAAVDSKTTDEESLRDSDYKFSMYKKRHAPLQLQAQRNPGFKGLKYAQDLAGFDPDYSSPTILTEKHCAFRVNKRFFDSEWNNSSNVSDGQLPKKGPGGKRKVEKESNKFIRALSKGFASEIDYYIVESFDEIRDEDDSNKGAMTWEYSRTSRDTDFKKSTTNNKGKDDLDLSEILREVTLNDNKTDDQEIKTMSAQVFSQQQLVSRRNHALIIRNQNIQQRRRRCRKLVEQQIKYRFYAIPRHFVS
eukprot:TRINITY_DN3998_c0_g2_i3.p1 TRINITY_DN3998_c0_g2~~TRINITY_DN3998_c0_g2_i3.p1  ORF type:complete len:490 (-),score=83.88 TRINITY_DN3998_c0_g2_i3:613-2082(-)